MSAVVKRTVSIPIKLTFAGDSTKPALKPPLFPQ